MMADKNKMLEASSKTLNKARDKSELRLQLDKLILARATACFDAFVRDFESILNGDELMEDKVLGDVDEDIIAGSWSNRP